MDFQSDYSRFSNLLEINKTWRLLRADSAPMILAFLKNLFANAREVDYDQARACLKEFLSSLKAKDESLQLQSAKDYLNDWMNPTNGWIKELNNKIYLTDAAQKAIEFADKLDAKIVSTSATHLQILQDQVHELFVQLTTDKRLRLQEVDRQIKELEKERAAISKGDLAKLSTTRQKEKIRTIYDLANRIPNDFRRLEEETFEIAQNIRVKMINDEASKGKLIKDVLKEEAIQRKTDYGAAYEDFFKLLCQAKLRDEFNSQIDFILDKPIAKHLDKKQQKFLHCFIDILVNECDRVRKVRAQIDANLRAYLESSEFKENRLLTKTISKLEKEAVKLKDTGINLYTKLLETSLEKGNVKVFSVESLKNAIKVAPKEAKLGEFVEHENSKVIRSEILKQIDTVKLSDVKNTIKKILGNASSLSVGSIIERTQLKYGLDEVVAFVRVARELNKDPILEQEEIIVKNISQHKGSLKIRLPKIILSSQMLRDSEDK